MRHPSTSTNRPGATGGGRDVFVVHRWTGVETRALRAAKRMSVREFATHLGVSPRMVSKWEAGGSAIAPRPFNQCSLDICLARASADEHARLLVWRREQRRPDPS